MISIDKNVLNLLKDAPRPSIIKIFFFIALNQPEDGVRGFITTKQQLASDLNLKQTVIFTSLRWLESNVLIQELKQVDDVEFMANPYFVMNNCDRQARIEEWKRRCRLDIQRELRLKKQRRLRELKNADKP